MLSYESLSYESLSHESVEGQGASMAFLHGWGLNRQVWSGVVPELSGVCRPLLLDLPGHGRSEAVRAPSTLQAWSDAALASVPASSIWLGWSLGGMVALNAAIIVPTQVRALVLIATNVRFSQGPAWPCAIEASVLDGFSVSLAQDYQGTLNRFLALQARGDEHARETVRTLRDRLTDGGMPTPEALSAGLSILHEADLVAHLPTVTCPVLLIGGEYDKLVPVAALKRMVVTLPQAELCIIKGAAHAPFLSHREEFIAAVSDFLARLPILELEGNVHG